MKQLVEDLGMLQDLTGQESGIVIYNNGDTIIANWSSLHGLPRLFVSGIIGMGGDGLRITSETYIPDISQIVNNDQIIYDINDDAATLAGTPGTVYTLEDDTLIIAPEDWN